MPFKSPKQQIFLKINHPEIHERWYKEHGNAPGLSKYLKKVKKNKKKSEIQSKLASLAIALDNKEYYKTADKIETIVAQLNEIGAGCKQCGAQIGIPATCNACGWTESLLCKNCTMKKTGSNNCPDCGLPTNMGQPIIT